MAKNKRGKGKKNHITMDEKNNKEIYKETGTKHANKKKGTMTEPSCNCCYVFENSQSKTGHFVAGRFR